MSLKQDRTADIDDLLHPARAFSHPMDVVRDGDLTSYEKRAILSSWASDACAVQDVPELRQLSGMGRVRFDDVMDALRELDKWPERNADSGHDGRTRSGSGRPGGLPPA